MIDGVKRKNIKYQGKIIFTPDHLFFFLGNEKCENEKGEMIANIISKTALDISKSGSKLISVCTDNFSTNISALDQDNPHCAQKLCGQNRIRSPCCVIQ